MNTSVRSCLCAAEGGASLFLSIARCLTMRSCLTDSLGTGADSSLFLSFFRAIAPTLYAVSEYRVDRLHQRLLQAASHGNCRAEAFQPGDFGVFDGSSVGVGGEFQDALVGESDLGSAVVPKLSEDDCEDAGEIAGLGRSQTIGSQLLRKFEVKEDAEELHAFFMQKECDRHLVRLFSGESLF